MVCAGICKDEVACVVEADLDLVADDDIDAGARRDAEVSGPGVRGVVPGLGREVVDKRLCRIGEAGSEAEDRHLAVGEIGVASLDADPSVPLVTDVETVEEAGPVAGPRGVEDAGAKSGADVEPADRPAKGVTAFTVFAGFRAVGAACFPGICREGNGAEAKHEDRDNICGFHGGSPFDR